MHAGSAMRALLRRLASISLLWQILLPTLLCVAIGIAAVQFWTISHTRALLQERLVASLNANLAMLQADIDRLGQGWRHDGDRLLIGEVALNGRSDVVDKVAQIAGGVATIFAGDVRVATTLRQADGSRAVGTKLAAGAARTAALDHGDTYRGTNTILGQDYVTIYQPLKDSAGAVAGLLFVGIPTAATEAALANSQRETVLVSVAVLGLLGVLVWLMVRQLLMRLVSMTDAMRRLAAGDTEVEIPAIRREDQVDRMAAALNVFKQNAIDNARLAREQEEQRAQAAADKRTALVGMADKIETETASSVEAVSRQTERMAATTSELADSAAHVRADATTASEAAGQALANTQTVASAAEQLSASIREIAGQVGRSSEIVAHAVQISRAAQGTISALTSRVAEIGTVAGMISDIAAKTNLLALNATIEAARAGEAGKGFAVVASEVKSLATQTARSTEDIGRHIGEVRTATDETVQAVGRIESAINEINQIATAIAAAVEEQGAATAEIARSVTKTSDAAREVATRVTSVTTQAVQSGTQAQEVHKHLDELAKVVVGLQHVVTRIVRTSAEEVDRRHESRVNVDLPAQMTMSSSATAQTVRVKDLSLHGAQIAGASAIEAGSRGSLAIQGVDAPVRFVAYGSEVGDNGQTLHIRFDDPAAERAIGVLMNRLGHTTAKAA
jgi:methyl-accepting chemotaxis protein